MVDTCHYTFVHRLYDTKSEPRGTYGLWVTTVCQGRLIKCNQCPFWGMLIMEETVHEGERRLVGNLYTFYSILLRT